MWTGKNEYSYEGGYVNDLYEGFGIYRWPSGDKYEGNFKGGKKNGQGLWTGCDGCSYEGEWVDDLCEGFGVFRRSDGSFYRGYFKKGKQ